MNPNSLWSLRLGFSNKQAAAIEKMGISKFLDASFKTNFDNSIPDFLKDSPKTFADYRELRKKSKELTEVQKEEQKRDFQKQEALTSLDMKAWWLEKMMSDSYPLQEKMTLFLHNHFVSTFQKVKMNYWIFEHNQLLRKHAFGNFKDLTKAILKSNAMLRYLDNVDNRKGKINENLSRELLELFTLGIGNYTEEDIKNGAKALAGLGIGENGGVYRDKIADDSEIIYFGKKGHFKVDDIVDIIFKQKNSPYLFTKKILQWFIYDNPSEALVTYYGDYFRKKDFEIKPLLEKIFTEEFDKNTAGSKIKNPLEYSLQLISELHINPRNSRPMVAFLKNQGMDLFNQPNVKGWEGGKSWLTSQIYLQRNNIADLYCSGRENFNQKTMGTMMDENSNRPALRKTVIQLDWNKGTNKEIISELSNRLLFQVDNDTQKDFENILKYDFDSQAQNADQAVLRLFNAIVKEPEFQLI
ncbi:DUF1800 domain-containing protein [Flavobacterium undicola]|uniref:DUF1800 domain-containing protein n=1 Tax=Flavobacterium undicola TaxID=1932779 RepID=UPI00137766CC|nr:DUF1800 domain-containing protein [Flavobacterium undicola]MBA0883287.1 DUF1800 domain-containing protein [Flavobacterium undicola]